MKHRKYAKWLFIIAGLLVLAGIIAGAKWSWIGTGLVYFGFLALFAGWVFGSIADDDEQTKAGDIEMNRQTREAYLRMLYGNTKRISERGSIVDWVLI